MTLTAVLRGAHLSAAMRRVHRVHLARITVSVPVSRKARPRTLAKLLGVTGLPGNRCAVPDAVVAATALERERPVVLLTSDPDDLGRLVEEPGRPKAQRITVVRV